MKKIAVFFPGLGYSAERPLLYYTKKILKGDGFDIVELEYSGRMPADITQDIRDNLLNPKTVKNAVLKYVTEAVKFCEEQLERSGKMKLLKELSSKDAGQSNIFFISKSIGSVVDTVFCGKHGVTAEHIFFTPLEQAFQFIEDSGGLAFSGLSDPVAKADIVAGMCDKCNIDFYTVEGGNHSLETGNVEKDIDNLSWIMNVVKDYLRSTEEAEWQKN